MLELHREDKTQVMQKNVMLIDDVQKLRQMVAEQKQAFNKLGGQKALDLVKAKQEAVKREREAAEGREERHAGPEEELEAVDGVDNSIQNTLAVKRRYIAQMREDLERCRAENAALRQRAGQQHLGPDTNQQDEF